MSTYGLSQGLFGSYFFRQSTPNTYKESLAKVIFFYNSTTSRKISEGTLMCKNESNWVNLKIQGVSL